MAIASSMALEQLSAVADALAEGLLAVDRQGLVVLANRRATEILQLPGDGILGQPVAEAFPESGLPELLAAGREEPERREERGGVSVLASRQLVRDPSGAVAGAVAVYRDVGELQALAAKVRSLQELRELSEAIVRCSQEAIAVADGEGRYALVNPAFSQLMGMAEEEMLHRPVSFDVAEGKSVLLEVLRTRRAVRGARLRAGPQQREVVVNAAPLLVGGELRGAVGVVHDVSEIRRLSDELASARRMLRQLQSRHTFEDIVGVSPALVGAKDLAARAARTPATVLLTGESGTGKEMFAHAIHHASDRAQGPFIRVNCAAVPENLLESALFGYEGGAFTGARAQGQKGYFEEANGGTLFLDEIGEAPLPLQAKLLRALQEREIVRVGSSAPVAVDVRLVAATNADLEERVARGLFRQDLLYRLSVMPIRIPGLRERPEDVPPLARALLARVCGEYGLAPLDLAADALEFLQGYPWKGNVREMENLIGRAVIHMGPEDRVLSRAHFEPSGSAEAVGHAPAPEGGGSFAQRKAAWERQLLRGALERHRGNRTATARSLGITVRNLYYKLRRHGLQ